MKKMRAYVNVLKMRVNMALNREYVYNYPVQAYIEPTLFCNLRCPACPTGLQLGLRPSATIKWDLFKSAIDEIGDYVFSLYLYNWGEPLLHRQTPEMVKYAKTKDMSIVMSTNLSLKLSGEYIERLVDSGLDKLIVSLDGTTPETYAKYRVRGDFQLVCENMLRIQAVKKKLGVQKPEIVWQFLVFKHNEDQIAQARAEFREWGADTLLTEGAIMPFAPYDEGFEPSTIPEFNMYHSDHHFQKETAKHDRSGRPCSWLYGIFVLNPNGKVSPCCASAAEQTDFGEYSGSRGFLEVWNNATFKRARTLFSKSGAPATNGNAVKSENNLVQIQTNSAKSLAENAADLVAGMAANLSASLKNDELICQKCPIPWRQDDVDNVIADEANRLVMSYKEQKSIKDKARVLLAYLLIGAPNWKTLARIRFGRLVGHFNLI